MLHHHCSYVHGLLLLLLLLPKACFQPAYAFSGGCQASKALPILMAGAARQKQATAACAGVWPTPPCRP